MSNIRSPHPPIVITISTDVLTGASEVKISQPVNPLWFIALLSQILNNQIIQFSNQALKPTQKEVPTNGGSTGI